MSASHRVHYSWGIIFSLFLFSLKLCSCDDRSEANALLSDINVLGCCSSPLCPNYYSLDTDGSLLKITIDLYTCSSAGGTFRTSPYIFTTIRYITIIGASNKYINGGLNIQLLGNIQIFIERLNIDSITIKGNAEMGGNIQYNEDLTKIEIVGVRILRNFQVKGNPLLLNITANEVSDLKASFNITQNENLNLLSLNTISTNSWVHSPHETSIDLSSNGFTSPSSFPTTFTTLNYGNATLNYNPFCDNCHLFEPSFHDCVTSYNCLPCTSNDSFCNGLITANNVISTSLSSYCCHLGCTSTYSDCDLNPYNGCELSINVNESEICGRCGSECEKTENAVKYGCDITTNYCHIDLCENGYGDCDRIYSNGCEVNLNTSKDHCNTCSLSCPDPNLYTVADVECVEGECTLICNPGYEDCNGIYLDGCEIPLGTLTDCANCSDSCIVAGLNTSCTAGKCVNNCVFGTGDCDGILNNGCETNIRTNLSHCGGCNSLCPLNPPNATSTCNAGQCIITCTAGFFNCDNNLSNGCESFIATDQYNCGGCGKRCGNLPNVNSTTCAGGECTLNSCATGYKNCDGLLTNGCEVNIANDPKKCGNCTNNCNDLPNISSVSCSASTCVINSCSSFYANCDGLMPNGCEIYLKNDTLNCGTCGKKCLSLPNVNTTDCVSSKCVILSCDNGYKDCDGLVSNGCETNIKSDVTNCNDCDNDCTSLANVKTASCTSGACGILSCKSNFGNCDGLTSTGCEASLNSVTVCGSCTKNCSSLPQVNTTTCTGGQCGISSCKNSYANCNNQVTDGCETQITTSQTNCGSCGNSCLTLPHVASASCENGVCTSLICTTGYENCDSSIANGCETYKMNSTTNCNGCGLNCLALPQVKNATCNNGVCKITSCKTGYANCDDSIPGCETLLSSSIENCGVCGKNCSALPNILPHGSVNCTASKCVIVDCESYFSDCDKIVENGCEVSYTNDPQNCGACGYNCYQNLPNVGLANCISGNCEIQNCNPGWEDCIAAVPGCETNILTNDKRCGNCNTNCINQPHVNSSICAQKKCIIQSCSSNYGDCDNDGLNGCETDLLTTDDKCGSCQNDCLQYNVPTNQVSSAYCDNGKCAIDCVHGFDNCDGNFTNGCEADLGNSLTTCLTCNNSCLNLPNVFSSTCITGVGCNITLCNNGFADCDTNPSNGCERNLESDPQFCGFCNVHCVSPPGATAICNNNTCGFDCNPGFANCNASAGCETNINTDASSCGSCKYSCTKELPNVQLATCVGGNCRITNCTYGFKNCNGIDQDGCETPVLNDINNCGDCAVSCRNLISANQSVCNAGACVVTQCKYNTLDCDNIGNNGCETVMDASNCGGCNKACNLTEAVATCVNQVCNIASCNAGFGNCDGVQTNGCEASLIDVAEHCGSCSNNCNNLPQVNVTQCVLSQCNIQSCAENYKDCNLILNDGCETNIKSDIKNCGGCGKLCPLNSSNVLSAVCSNQTCTIHCQNNFDDCNRDPSDGCEANLQANETCGSCSVNCNNLTNVLDAACNSSSCVINSCAPTYLDCDRNAINGCEASTLDITSCESCSTNCLAIPNTMNQICSVGGCRWQCIDDFADCNSQVRDGCETNATTVTNCGSCNVNCLSLPNVNDVSCDMINNTRKCRIRSCKQGFANCNVIVDTEIDGCETNIYSSPTKCGSCGNNCLLRANVNSSLCVDGKCKITECKNGFIDCDKQELNGCEVEIQSDVENCGSCRNSCMNLPNVETAECQGGICKILSCNPTFIDADGIVNNGCEVNIMSNINYCGTNNPRSNCSSSMPNAIVVCKNGECEMVGCMNGFGNCDHNDTNGCESLNNVNNCGTCGISCSELNKVINASCSSDGKGSFVCGYDCAQLWGDCDGNITNGCETNLTEDTHCNSCGNNCNLLPNTNVGACRNDVIDEVYNCEIRSCKSGYDNCDENVENGCETKLDEKTSCSTCKTNCNSLANIQSSNCIGGNTDVDPYSNCEYTCRSGFDHCSASPSSGCETNIMSDLQHCGSCDNDCRVIPNTIATSCQFGKCRIDSCAQNFGDCDRIVENGCETDLTTPSHCGKCSRSCYDLKNVNDSLCVEDECIGVCDRICIGLICDDGFGNCDNVNENGCEANLKISEADCGSCGNTCSELNNTVSSICDGGVCSILCKRNFEDCDHLTPNGCEVMISSDMSNCGGCGVSCIGLPNVASSKCENSKCIINECLAGYADCDRNTMTGCEVQINSTVGHCGSCTRDCGLLKNVKMAECTNSQCGIIDCQSGYQDCDQIVGNGCELIINDVEHCGSCHVNCSKLAHILEVECNIVEGNIGEVNEKRRSENHHPTRSVVVVDCKCHIVDCQFEFGNCDGNEENGCETQLNTIDNCGECGHGCTSLFANAEVGCFFGECEMIECFSGYANCDRNNTNGCETNILNSMTSCGACNLLCSYPNAITQCIESQCILLSCINGFMNADQIDENGCEAISNVGGGGGDDPYNYDISPSSSPLPVNSGYDTNNHTYNDGDGNNGNNDGSDNRPPIAGDYSDYVPVIAPIDTGDVTYYDLVSVSYDPATVTSLNGNSFIYINLVEQNPSSFDKNTAFLSPVVDISTFNANIDQTTFTICFTVDTTKNGGDDNTDDMCLAYRDTSSNGEWKCEDKCLKKDKKSNTLSSGLVVCGNSEHLTDFTVLFGGIANNGGKCGDSGREYILGSYNKDLILIGSVAGFVVLVAILFVIIVLATPLENVLIGKEGRRFRKLRTLSPLTEEESAMK